MKKTNIYLFRDGLASYLDEINKTGDSLVVYKYNQPIAIVSPPKKSFIEKDFGCFFGFLEDSGETGVEFENRIRRGKKEKEYIKKLRKGVF